MEGYVCRKKPVLKSKKITLKSKKIDLDQLPCASNLHTGSKTMLRLIATGRLT